MPRFHPDWGADGGVFGLIWVAWLKRSLCHEIHGQRDGRIRVFVRTTGIYLVGMAITIAAVLASEFHAPGRGDPEKDAERTEDRR